jgi:serine/threonine protein kinase
LHRDIKPSNLIWGADEQVYLVDFGAVQDKAAREGATFTIVGTYGYTPIEQFGGRAVPASDLYALGATLIHLLTGTAPADLPQQNLRIHFSDRVSISSHLVRWLESLIQPSLEERVSTAHQALMTLKSNHALGSKPIHNIRQPLNSRVQLSKSPAQLSIVLPSQALNSFNVTVFSLKLFAMGAMGLFIFIATLSALFGLSFIGFGFLLIFCMGWYKILDETVASTFGHHYVCLDRKHFKIEWRLFSSCRHRQQGLTVEIQDVFQSVLQMGRKSNFLQPENSLDKEIITIQTGEKRYSFGVGLSAVECVWLAQEIKDWLNSDNRR